MNTLTVLSPYLTLLLSILVLYKWVLRLAYNFQWNQIGAVAARFIFCVLYGIVITYTPPAENLRLLVRLGVNLLFIDELINWGVSSGARGIDVIRHIRECARETNKIIREIKLH